MSTWSPGIPGCNPDSVLGRARRQMTVLCVLCVLCVCMYEKARQISVVCAAIMCQVACSVLAVS